MSDENGITGEPEGDEEKHVFDDPRNVKRVIYALFTICGLLLAIDLLDVFGVLYHKHAHFPFEGWFGFFGFFGFFLSCALVLAAKGMRVFLKRDEDYYDD